MSLINFNISKNIISHIENKISENFDDIQKLLEDDNKFFSETCSYIDIMKSLKLIKNENWNFKDSNCIYTSSGNIAVIYNETPNIAIYLILKAIKTNNNLVLFEKFNSHKSTKKIISIVKDVLEEYNLNLIINSKKYNKIEDIISYKDFFNKYLVIGNKIYYNTLKTKLDTPIYYNAFGTVSLYLEDKTNKASLLEIDDYVFKNNIKLDIYKDEINKVIKELNQNGENFMLIIFSNDKEKIKLLVENVNCKFICVNKNPFYENYNIFIDDEILFNKKNVIL